MPVSTKTYIGHQVVASQTDFPSASALADAPLSEVAMELRTSLNALDDNHVRSLATLLSRTEDKSAIFYGAHHVPGQDFMATSSGVLGLYTTDFGLVRYLAASRTRKSPQEYCGPTYQLGQPRHVNRKHVQGVPFYLIGRRFRWAA